MYASLEFGVEHCILPHSSVVWFNWTSAWKRTYTTFLCVQNFSTFVCVVYLELWISLSLRVSVSDLSLIFLLKSSSTGLFPVVEWSIDKFIVTYLWSSFFQSSFSDCNPCPPYQWSILPLHLGSRAATVRSTNRQLVVGPSGPVGGCHGQTGSSEDLWHPSHKNIPVLLPLGPCWAPSFSPDAALYLLCPSLPHGPVSGNLFHCTFYISVFLLAMQNPRQGISIWSTLLKWGFSNIPTQWCFPDGLHPLNCPAIFGTLGRVGSTMFYLGKQLKMHWLKMKTSKVY